MFKSVYVFSVKQTLILCDSRMHLHLLLFVCLLALFTSLTVTSSYFLQVLEIRLFIIGQLITTWNLYCRGENLWRLSINIFAIFALFFMSFSPAPSEPNAPVNTFILIPLAYLLVGILLVDETKFVRGMFTNLSLIHISEPTRP